MWEELLPIPPFGDDDDAVDGLDIEFCCGRPGNGDVFGARKLDGENKPLRLLGSAVELATSF